MPAFLEAIGARAVPFPHEESRNVNTPDDLAR